MLQPYFVILGLQVNFYGIFIALAILAVYLGLTAKAKDFGIKTSEIDTIFLFSLPFGLIGARVYHVLSDFQHYWHKPLEIFSIWHGGLGIFGAILGFLCAILLYCHIKKIRPLLMLNFIFPWLLLAQAIGRIGNFFNQEGFGLNRFPTFFLEAILCVVAFGIFLLLPQKIKTRFGFSYYLITYGLIRFSTEFFRTDTWMIGEIKLAHLLSLFFIVLGVYLFKKRQT